MQVSNVYNLIDGEATHLGETKVDENAGLGDRVPAEVARLDVSVDEAGSSQVCHGCAEGADSPDAVQS